MRFLTPAFVTLAMIVVVGFLVLAYIWKTFFWQEELPPPAQTVRLVPMTATDIPAGTLITEEHLVTGRSTEDLPRETIMNSDKIIGRYALKDLKQAQKILTSDLYAPGARPPLDLTPGMRALTIGLGESTDVVDGLIKPDDYVDVHLSIADNSGDPRYQGGFTMTLFKGVRVLAMNRLTQPTALSRGANTVTFELTPEQSNILLEAQSHGDIVVSYTGNGPGTGGVEVADADRAHFKEILNLPEPPEPKKPFLTEIWRAGSKSYIGYGDDWDDNWNGRDWGAGTPWIEQPGWAPPRDAGYGNGYNRGYGGRGYQGYNGGYRGTQVAPPRSSNPENQGQSGNGFSSVRQNSGRPGAA